MTLLEGMIGIIAISLLIGIVVLARLANRIGAAADSVGLAARRAAELAPAARGVVDDVRIVTSRASAVGSQVLQGFESEVIDRYRAIFAGARAGFDVLRRLRSGNGSAGAEEFDHMER